jgi:PAP2 superfamily
MRTVLRRGPFAASAFLAMVVPVATCAGADDVVREWNKHAAGLSVAPASALAGVQQARAMAIVQVSVYDAVNSITKEFESYTRHTAPPAGASAETAAIGAAHQALVTLFPNQMSSLAITLSSSLAAHGLSSADPGLAFGRSVATDILALRDHDGSDEAQFNYTAPGAGAPGVWVPLTSAPAVLPGWGNVTPWVLHSGSQFRPGPPPALDSEQYANNYNEIVAIGAATGSTRTAEQTQIALFWRATATAIWNQVIDQVLATRHLNLSETARALALFYLAADDAGIACWDAKYTYNSWRPLSATRRAADDGNDSTQADPLWQPFIATPAHPEYPSGHSTVSSAMAAVLERLFGEPDVPLSVLIFDSLSNTNITRRWETFRAGVDEVIEARIYSGIHFRTADEVGARLGRQTAQFVLTHALRPCRGRGSRACGDR